MEFGKKSLEIAQNKPKKAIFPAFSPKYGVFSPKYGVFSPFPSGYGRFFKWSCALAAQTKTNLHVKYVILRAQ